MLVPWFWGPFRAMIVIQGDGQRLSVAVLYKKMGDRRNWESKRPLCYAVPSRES